MVSERNKQSVTGLVNSFWTVCALFFSGVFFGSFVQCFRCFVVIIFTVIYTLRLMCTVVFLSSTRPEHLSVSRRYRRPSVRFHFTLFTCFLRFWFSLFHFPTSDLSISFYTSAQLTTGSTLSISCPHSSLVNLSTSQ